MPTPDPEREYQRRLEDRRRLAATLARADARLSLARLVVVVIGALVGWAVFDPARLAIGWLALPVLAFVALVVLHEQVARRRLRLDRAVRFYERGLARIRDRWDENGFDGLVYLDVEHPYAGDLDLFGPGSLYQLLCACRTGIGRSTLATWLLEPATIDEIQGRQAAVQELATDLDLRERIAVLGDDLGADIHASELLDWGAAPRALPGGWLRWLPALLVTALIGSSVALLFGFGSRILVGIAFAAEAGFGLWVRPRIDLVIATAARPGRELEMLVGVLESVEERHFESERLQRAVRALESDGALPSAVVRRLQRLLVLLDSRRNQFFAPLAVLLMWGTQMAMALEAWRDRHGDAISRWVVAVGEFEALASLSAYHYERPEDTFPELVERGPCFRAVALGHPLLQRHVCVRNDVCLDASHSLLVVSGSNMSGKSTLLRAVGVNAVLALAGAPVRARQLALSCLHVGGTLRVQDSLRQGMSGFYAEIQRFRQLVDLASQSPPLLFLLEEILNTTNSHERRIGAEAVIGSLLRRRAIGLVTTHDLAITEVVHSLPGTANVHFVDHLEGGHIRFDYVLRPGVVGKGNAIDLMQSIGLEL